MITFMRGCPGCLRIIHYTALDTEVTCPNCNHKSKLNGGRSEYDQDQLELFVKADTGPRVLL